MARSIRVAACVLTLAVLSWTQAGSENLHGSLPASGSLIRPKAWNAGAPMACSVVEAVAAAGHSVTLQFRTLAPKRAGGAKRLPPWRHFPWSQTSSFEKTCYASSPLGSHQMVFFYLADKLPGWISPLWEDLKKLRIGGSRGYAYAEMFEAAGIKADYAPGRGEIVRQALHRPGGPRA